MAAVGPGFKDCSALTAAPVNEVNLSIRRSFIYAIAGTALAAQVSAVVARRSNLAARSRKS
jgi:hypothetical protein